MHEAVFIQETVPYHGLSLEQVHLTDYYYCLHWVLHTGGLVSD